MKLILIMITVFAVIFTGACGSTASASKGGEVVLDDGYKTSGEELVIDDTAFREKTTQVLMENEQSVAGTQTLPDKTEVETLIDGFGNKTQTRVFPGHPRLRFVILRTAIDGTTNVTVYGYGSDTVTLGDLGDKALSASGDEIANAAKLYATRSYSDTPNFMRKRKGDPSLSPLPSSEFPIRSQQTPQPQSTEPVESSQSRSDLSSDQSDELRNEIPQ